MGAGKQGLRRRSVVATAGAAMLGAAIGGRVRGARAQAGIGVDLDVLLAVHDVPGVSVAVASESGIAWSAAGPRPARAGEARGPRR